MLYSTELYHHGIKGMKWGVRRYQNPDGTLTEAGKKRLRVVKKASKYAKKQAKKYEDNVKKDSEILERYRTGDPRRIVDYEYWRVGESRLPLPITANQKALQYEDRIKINTENAKDWLNKLDYYSNTPISEIKGLDYLRAKSYANRF